MVYRRSQLSLWILSSFLLVIGCGFCLIRWRAERSAVQSVLENMTVSFRRVEQQVTRANITLNAFGEALHRIESKVDGVTDKVLHQTVSVAETREELAESDGPPNEEPRAPDPNSLPTLPGGVSPFDMITSELEDILKNPKLDLPKVELSRLQTAKLQAYLFATRAQVAAVDGELKIALVEGMNKLRDDGNYIDYNRGESYQHTDGVLTAGEEAPDGRVRMYYLQREQFPLLYEKREAKEKLAETASRQLLSMLKEETSK
jgi:hypothetical protein